MKIDKVVEPVVREAFAAAVAEEPDRFDAALADVANRGDRFARAAVALAVAVDSMALMALHEGERLDDDELKGFARDFVESQSWSGISEDNAYQFLAAVSGADRQLPDILPAGDIGQISFVLGSWLLSAFLPEDKDWTDFLDEILDMLESAPDQ